MHIKLFMLRYIPEQNIFDETILQQFLQQYSLEVIECQSSFYTISGLPACAVLLVYRKKEESRMPNLARSQAFVSRVLVPQMIQSEGKAVGQEQKPIAEANPAPSVPQDTSNNTNLPAPTVNPHVSKSRYRKEELPDLPPEDIVLWKALKKWRIEQARKTGIPAYTFFLNEQIFQMISSRPKTLEELKRNCGFGHKRIENFGRDLLRIIALYPKHPAGNAKNEPAVQPTLEKPVEQPVAVPSPPDSPVLESKT
ncbi:MAG: HRDC domain-containing protein [Candidatus Brocadiae bacterium]|nr:HRDC domain-containing protein [Candidatus Brocadiia bacterium]